MESANTPSYVWSSARVVAPFCSAFHIGCPPLPLDIHWVNRTIIWHSGYLWVGGSTGDGELVGGANMDGGRGILLDHSRDANGSQNGNNEKCHVAHRDGRHQEETLNSALSNPIASGKKPSRFKGRKGTFASKLQFGR